MTVTLQKFFGSIKRGVSDRVVGGVVLGADRGRTEIVWMGTAGTFLRAVHQLHIHPSLCPVCSLANDFVPRN